MDQSYNPQNYVSTRDELSEHLKKFWKNFEDQEKHVCTCKDGGCKHEFNM
jgi:hypothetical protein